MKTHSIIPGILFAGLALSAAGEPAYPQPLTPEHNPWANQGIAANFGFGAYYTRKNVDEEWHLLSRTDEFADVMVRFPGSSRELVFWRGSSFLPYWNTGDKHVSLEEIIPRKGDGPAERPDQVNR